MGTSANLDSKKRVGQILPVVGIILVFWLIYFIFYLLEPPYHSFLASNISLRSVYTMGDELSKFFLFILILISVMSYQLSSDRNKIKLSISLLLLGLVLYMAESNMITEDTQPIFGLIIIPLTGLFFLRLRAWLSFILFVLSFLPMSGGVILDFARESELLFSRTPPFFLNLINSVAEERLDALGIATLCLSVILYFRILLRDFLAKSAKGAILIILASGMITAGDGFLHYQYKTRWELHFAALVLTSLGFLGFIFANRKISEKYVLRLVTEEFLYSFIFFLFVLMPSIYGVARHSTSLVLWLPSMLVLGLYLWRRHPVNAPAANRARNGQTTPTQRA